MTAAEPVVIMTGVTKRHMGPPPVDALCGIDLTVHPGTALAVTGPSGSGKSTLLNILGLMDRPDQGTLSIAGRDTKQLAEPERSRFRSQSIGFIFQQFHLLSHRTVLENVALPLHYQGIAVDTAAERAREALLRVDMGSRMDATARQLSGGEQQRVAIARATVTRPPLVLADEPTGNLDSANSRAVMGLLQGVAEAGRAVVVVSHDPDVAALCDRQIELRDGVPS